MVLQFNKENPEQMGEKLVYSSLSNEEKAALGKYRCEAMKRAEEMHQNPRAYTREDRKKLRLDLEFAQLVYENQWTDEEAEENREAFYRQKNIEKKRNSETFQKEWDVIYNGGKNLTEFERRQITEYMKSNPEDEAIITGMVNMVAAGINDPEHVTEYAD